MQAELRQRIRLTNFRHFLAFGFGSGLAPKAPGTFGTLAAVPLAVLSGLLLDNTWYIAVTLLFAVAGIWICGKTADDMQVHDDPSIVWDEVVGMMITLIAVPLSWQTVVAGFILFRVFDIVKPWPISYLDQHVHGGAGIMADDILAGVFALGSLHLLNFYQLI